MLHPIHTSLEFLDHNGPTFDIQVLRTLRIVVEGRGVE